MTEVTRNHSSPILACCLVIFTLTSCSTTKYLEVDEILHQKTKVILTNPESFNNKNRVKRDLLRISQPKPNNKIKLRFYNFMGVPRKEKGLWHWLGNKFGEPPTFFDDARTSRSQVRIERYLRNIGYLGADVETDTISRGQKMRVTYRLTSQGQHVINSIPMPDDTSQIVRLFKNHLDETHIDVGQAYHLSEVTLERNRIARLAHNNGYFRFAEDDIYFLADTTAGDFQIDLYLFLKKKDDEISYQTFTLGDTYVHVNYNLRAPQQAELKTMPSLSGLYYTKDNHVIKEAVIDRLIPQRHGDLYSKALQDVSFRRLQGLGLFKFVNIKYEQDSTGHDNKVHRYFFLTPGKMQDVTATLELDNQTGNLYGSTAGLTYTHKNLFGGAERLNLSLTGRLATQLNNATNFINTSQLDFKVSFSVPHLITPFRTTDVFGPYIPKTIISAGLGLEERVQFYAVQTAEFKFGYRWQSSPREQHELYPLSFNMFKLTNSSPEFDEYRAQSLRLSRSFDNTMLGGLKYSYTYTNMTNLQQKKAIYFNGELETSGNLLYLISRLGKNSADEPFKLFGLPVSQFFKINADLRHYTNYRNTRLVTRIYVGLGLVYGNSDELPYSRQFVIGGANSLRAFQLRGLGPGSFVAEGVDNPTIDEQFLDQTGDLKLEMNIEYRYPIIGFLKGAVFMDAGNIWLINNAEIPEGNFKFGRFTDEIALGAGVGLRLDFNYFVIRLDTSFAWRKPVGTTGFAWTVGDFDPFDRQWRKDNLSWHLAIGYPF